MLHDLRPPDDLARRNVPRQIGLSQFGSEFFQGRDPLQIRAAGALDFPSITFQLRASYSTISVLQSEKVTLSSLRERLQELLDAPPEDSLLKTWSWSSTTYHGLTKPGRRLGARQ